jgi:hydroxymethylbilane synthase
MQWSSVPGVAAVLDLLCPPRCVVCGAEAARGPAVCGGCARVLAAGLARCTTCGEERHAGRCRRGYRGDGIVVLSDYVDDVRTAVLRAKRPTGEPLAAGLGELLVAKHRDVLLGWRLDGVVPVPMHWLRRMVRGTSAADEIATGDRADPRHSAPSPPPPPPGDAAAERGAGRRTPGERPRGVSAARPTGRPAAAARGRRLHHRSHARRVPEDSGGGRSLRRLRCRDRPRRRSAAGRPRVSLTDRRPRGASTMSAPTPLRIGTRGSALARTQTEQVASRLREAGVAVTVEVISTLGDRRHDLPVARLGGDGVFVRELEQALLDGRIDAAVHSLKDLPTAETPGLLLAAIPERASPFDAVVGRSAPRLAELPRGATVGTSSIRRVAQLRAIRPDLDIVPLRGNVDSRLRRLDAGDFDAVILAAAGLERLGLAARITEVLRPPAFWPAVSQGALAIQTRADDAASRRAVGVVDDAATRAAVVAERRMLAGLAGGCLAPIGGWARIEAEELVLGGRVFDVEEGPEPRSSPAAELRRAWSVDRDDVSTSAEALGSAVAGLLVAQGANRLIERVRAKDA